MRVSLVMTTVDDGERAFLLEKERTVIGSSSRCDLRVAVPPVADRHCELKLNGKELSVRDLGSGGGTFCNGQRIDQTVLKPGDIVTVGPAQFVVRMELLTPENNKKS